MFWGVYYLLLLLPLLLAGLAGRFCGRAGLRWITFPVVLAVSAYPLGHWYLLRGYRAAFFNLDFKSEVVAAMLSRDLMFLEVPLALIAALLGWWRARRYRTRTEQ